MPESARSVVVTGAASGIGLATARRLAADGWAVACVDNNADGVADVVKGLRAMGSTADGVHGDVADPAVHAQARRAAENLAPLGAWVGVAGVSPSFDLRTVSEDDVRRVVDINQLGILWGAREALLSWDAVGSAGTIVIISSVHARHAASGSGVYEMTKAAIEALARNIAISYGREGVRAVAAAPGAISTPALQASFETAANPSAARSHLERQAPLNRLGDTEEIAATVSFVVSDQASFISGTTITVDGGLSSVLMLPSLDPEALRPPKN